MTPADVLRHMSTVQDEIAMRCGYAPATARKYQELAAAGRNGAACIEFVEKLAEVRIVEGMPEAVWQIVKSARVLVKAPS